MIWFFIVVGVLAAIGIVAMFVHHQSPEERDALGDSLSRDRDRGWG